MQRQSTRIVSERSKKILDESQESFDSLPNVDGFSNVPKAPPIAASTINEQSFEDERLSVSLKRDTLNSLTLASRDSKPIKSRTRGEATQNSS